jgi:GDP-4-dehydro-6-deoxy-D-mannose reductase
MRVLITGINGFAGGHLVEHLVAETDWTLWGVARGGMPKSRTQQEHINIVDIDLLDSAAVHELVREVQPDIVFHLAAQAHVPTSFADPAGTLSSNILMQLHTCEAIRAAKLDPRILIVSTGEVYGAVEPHNIPIDEDVPLRPTNPYAVSKAAQDLLAFQYYVAHKLRIVRVRPFNHTGPRQGEGYAPTAFAQQVARIEAGLQSPVVKVGNLEAQRDISDVRDIVRAYRLAVEHGEPGAVYNLGSGQPTAIQTILDMLIGMSQAEIAVETDPQRMRPVDVPVVACDATRFRERTGWQLRIPLQQTLRDVLNDWRERIKDQRVSNA